MSSNSLDWILMKSRTTGVGRLCCWILLWYSLFCTVSWWNGAGRLRGRISLSICSFVVREDNSSLFPTALRSEENTLFFFALLCFRLFRVQDPFFSFFPKNGGRTGVGCALCAAGQGWGIHVLLVIFCTYWLGRCDACDKWAHKLTLTHVHANIHSS